MNVTDSLVNAILKEMGVEPNKPARWMVHKHKTISQRTGEVLRVINDGYICSRCGKHSYAMKSVCDGCNSKMPIEERSEP